MSEELEVQRAMSACRWILGWMVCVIAILTCATIVNTWGG